MGTYVSMSKYVSCAGMSRRTYGSCENCVYKEGVSRVFSSSSLHATSCILFGISTSSPVPPFPPFPYLRIGDARLAPPVSVRHVRPTLSVSLFDTSVCHCPFLSNTSVRRYPTRPSGVVRSCPTHPSDAVRRCLPFPFPFPFPSRSRSRSRSCSRSIPVPVPVPPPRFRSRSRLHHPNSLEYLGEPPPLQFLPQVTLARVYS